MDDTKFPYISIQTILDGKVNPGEKIALKGWVKTRRDSKAGFSFIALTDGSNANTFQIVAPNSLSNYQNILQLTSGCSIGVSGTLTESPASGQKYELQAEEVLIYGMVENPETYPISPKNHTFEYLREYLHLRSRTNFIGSLTRIRHVLSQAIHRFFDERGFYWIATPLITTSDCEGAGQMFRVTTLDMANIPKQPNGAVDYSQDFFGKETFLTVSGQLNVESYCLALSKVYTFGPTFRAENSNTSRHLSEFWMIEPEVAFADLNDNDKLAEDMIRYLCQVLLDKCQDDLALFQERLHPTCIQQLESIVKSETFEHLDYKKAVEYLLKSGKEFEFPVQMGCDLQSEHERYITEELIGRPTIVKNYPKQIKSFYMRVNPEGDTVAAMDVLVPGIGEIIGGSQREERIDVLKQRIVELGLDPESYEWYLDLRRYGSVPHAGFGLGFERFISYVTGIGNIRDAIPFPRTPKRADL